VPRIQDLLLLNPPGKGNTNVGGCEYFIKVSERNLLDLRSCGSHYRVVPFKLSELGIYLLNHITISFLGKLFGELHEPPMCEWLYNFGRSAKPRELQVTQVYYQRKSRARKVIFTRFGG
jgi:hypothetical protein